MLLFIHLQLLLQASKTLIKMFETHSKLICTNDNLYHDGTYLSAYVVAKHDESNQCG
jgi:hypothetical protein